MEPSVQKKKRDKAPASSRFLSNSVKPIFAPGRPPGDCAAEKPSTDFQRNNPIAASDAAGDTKRCISDSPGQFPE